MMIFLKSSSKYKESMDKATLTSTIDVIGHDSSYIYLCGRTDKQKIFVKATYKQLFEKETDDGFDFLNSLLSGGKQIALKFPEVQFNI